jgi:thioester reductase-like protein
MIPSLFVYLDALPLTRNGKIDRKALGAEVGGRAGAPRPAAGGDPSNLLEEEVGRVFAETLGLERVGLHDDFFELGGTSLLVSRVGARLGSAYNIDLPLHEFFTVPTVAGVSKTIGIYRRKGHQGILETRDPKALAAEAFLPPEIRAEGLSVADHTRPAGVLLTGATGYLGAFLLEQLLAETAADVYCLVRAEDAAAARRRIRETIEKFQVPWHASFDRRLHPVPGDLGKPLLGLAPDAFAALSRSVDSIYHNGALVNFVFPYSVMKAPNVGGTREILRLACHERAKAVHYVSTIDVLIGSHSPRPFLEDPLPPEPRRVPFSYPQSKWIAETMCMTARERGVPVSIFRPSIMMGHSVTGACHETDYILVALKGFLDLGILPEYREILNSIPVDFASRAIVSIGQRPQAIGGIFHLWHVDAVPTMKTYDWIRSFGYEFDIVPFETAFRRANAVAPSHPIYPLLPVLHLYAAGDSGARMEWEIHKEIDARSECARTLELLEGTGIECPPIDEKYMHDVLGFLSRSGQLAAPVARRKAS